MKMKKIVSAFLALALATSATAISSLAAAPVVLTNEVTVVFEQNFGGLNEAADLADFNVNGEWQYFGSFMGQYFNGEYKCNGTVMTKQAYDLTSYSYWEYETEVIATGNGYYIYLGWDEAAGKGYRLKWDNSKKILSLFKAGNSTAVKTASLSSLYGANTKYNIIYSNGKLSVKQNSTEVLTYDVAAADFNGKFGIQGSATSMLILFDMNLTAGGNTTVNRWIYEEEFDGETVASLTDKGWTLPSSAKIFSGTDTYINMSASKSTATYNTALTGNYGIKAKQQIGYNAHHAYITIKSSDNSYYKITPATAKTDAIAKLEKYDAATGKTTILDTASTTYIDYACYEYDIKVYTGESETKIIADVYAYDNKNNSVSVTLEETDSSTPISAANKVQIYWGATNDCNLYNLSTYSIIDDTEKEEIQVNKVVRDKTFTSADTYKTAGNAGFYGGADKAPDYSFKTYTSFSDKYGLSFPADTVYYNYSGTVSDYSVKTTMYKSVNDSELRFNESSDGKSYYSLKAASNGSREQNVSLVKVVNGTVDDTWTKKTSALNGTKTGVYNFSDFYVNCDYQDDGSLKITAEFQAHDQEKYTLSAEDAAPLSGNEIEMVLPQKGAIKSFKLTAPTTETDCDGDMPIFKARFYNEAGVAVEEIENGAIYANTFAMLMDNYTVTAAIYENGVMTGIKAIEPTDLYERKVKLFDVTDAANTEIKLFMFDNNKSLNKLPQSCVLN